MIGSMTLEAHVVADEVGGADESTTLPPDIERVLQACERRAARHTVASANVAKKLDTLIREIDRGEVTLDGSEFEDPSVVRHVEELRKRVKAATHPPTTYGLRVNSGQ